MRTNIQRIDFYFIISIVLFALYSFHKSKCTTVHQSQETTQEKENDVYPNLLSEARQRSSKDYKVYHIHGKKGVAIGPVGGAFKHTLKALKNARRTRNILREGSGVKVALVTSKEHKLILEQYCGGDRDGGGIVNIAKDEIEEACRLYSNGTLLDNIIETWSNPPYTNESHVSGNKNKGTYTSRFQMMSLGGAFRAPYIQTLILDSDAFTCPGFEKLFDALIPYSNNHWSAPSLASADLAIGLEQFHDLRNWPIPFKYNPGSGKWHSDFENFSLRNTGAHLWNFEREHTHVFAHFLVLVAEYLYNVVATAEKGVVNDQDPFRLALYLYQRMVPQFHEVNFSQHASCRTYPDEKYAGLDGARNGMYPVQPDGMICSDCRCTPCLIAHNAATLFVTVNGRKGWESNMKILNGSNSLPS